MKTITYNELWAVLPADARERACVAFWRARDDMSKQVQPAVLTALAASLRFREKFLKAQSDEQKGALLLRRMNQPDLRNVHGDLLRVFLLLEHARMIEEFLEVQGIPHQGCMLEDDAPPPAESLRKGIRAIRAAYGDWNVGLYLGFILAPGPDDYWAALPAAIAAEGLSLRAALFGTAAVNRASPTRD